jgi:hypothetical protein
MSEPTAHDESRTDQRPVMPPRLSDGSKPVQSLGKFIDNLLGDRRIRARAEKRVNDLFRSP